LQCAAWFPEEEQDKLAAVARWTAALTPLLKMHCRWQTDVHTQLKVRQLTCMLLCTAAMHCSVLMLCPAVCCSVLQHAVLRCDGLCSVLSVAALPGISAMPG